MLGKLAISQSISQKLRFIVQIKLFASCSCPIVRSTMLSKENVPYMFVTSDLTSVDLTSGLHCT